MSAKPKRRLGPLRKKVTRKPKHIPKVKEVVFDEDARRDFLTGFSKRKQERKAASRQRAEAKIKQEQKELRKSVREERKARAAANVAADRNALGIDDEVDQDEAGDDVEDQREFETDDFHVSVTVEEFDVNPQPQAPKVEKKPGTRISKAGNTSAKRDRTEAGGGRWSGIGERKKR